MTETASFPDFGEPFTEPVVVVTPGADAGSPAKTYAAPRKFNLPTAPTSPIVRGANARLRA